MGGGADSRIPALLREALSDVRIVIRTYDFDPDVAAPQIASWVQETHPDLVVGESLGAIHALCLRDLPVLLVSPALNAPLFFLRMSDPARLRVVRRLLERKYRAQEGQRQEIHFRPMLLKRWSAYRQRALHTVHPSVYAFFGTHDHYRRSGVVRVSTYRKYFGETYTMYHGSHYMEEEHVGAMLVPEIRRRLSAV